MRGVVRTARPDVPALLQIVRFLVTGVLNTGVGLAVIYVAWKVFGLPELVANGIGYAVGLCVSFVVNRRWTFSSDASARTAIPRFLAVFAVSYLANLGTFMLLLRGLDLRMEWATLIANVPYTIVFFIGSRWFVFPQRLPARAAPRWAPAPVEPR